MSIATDYLPTLRGRIEQLLSQQRVQPAAELMTHYSLLKDDYDFAQDVTTYKKLKARPAPFAIETKTKSAFTRLVNKNGDRDGAAARRARMGVPATSAAAEDDDGDDDGGSDDDSDA